MMNFGVLLEKQACTVITESLSSGLDTWKTILIKVFETIISFDWGRDKPSSGKAEVKVQSFSTNVPLMAW